MPAVTYKNTEYVIPEIPLAPSYVVARAGPIFIARNGRTGLYQFIDEDLYRLLIQCKEELKKTEGGMILLKAGEYMLSSTFPDEDVRDKVFVTGEGRSTVVKAPSGVSPFNPNWVRLDNLLWYDEAGTEHDETLVVVTEVGDGAITNPKIANLAVTTEKIADGAVENTKIADNTIDLSRKALDGSLTNEKIADGTIDLTKKCTYVPVNKAGDSIPYLQFSSDGTIMGEVRAKPYELTVNGLGDTLGLDAKISVKVYKQTYFSGYVYPASDSTYLLGDTYYRWKRVYTVDTSLASLTADPTLASGLLWFRSDLGRLRFSPDGSAVKEFVHRDGDTMTGDLTISKTIPVLTLNDTSGNLLTKIQSSQTISFLLGGSQILLLHSGGAVFYCDPRGSGDLVRSLGASYLRWNNLYLGGVYTGGGKVAQDWLPNAHATYDLGKSDVRWNNIYGVNLYGTLIQAGDLGFNENTCPLCGREFQLGDEVVLKVVGKEGGIRTRPCHKNCPA
jgi:hypothetical protein